MAIMIPDAVREGTVSVAERNLFNRFRRELADSNYVLHSLGLTNHKNKLWGECDFVILSPYGVYVIEVKGGGVSCHNGKWIYTRRDGGKTEKLEGPFEQAKSAMFAIREIIDAKPGLRRGMIGYGVIMPDETFTQEGPEIENNVLLDSRKYHRPLNEYLSAINGFWTQCYSIKHGSHPDLFTKPMLEEIRQLLRPEVRSALTLNSSLCMLEKQQVELTDEQCRVLRRMDKNPRTLICGGAGTGKTILAMDKAIEKAKLGQRVLLLCYNKLLGKHLKESIKGQYDSHLTVNSVHALFSAVIEEAGLENQLRRYSERDDHYFTQHYPEVFIEAFIKLGKEPFDILVLDEAQDLLAPHYLDTFDLLLTGGLAEGSWHFFIDPLQNIFTNAINDTIIGLNKFGMARFDLTVNCRNTMAVAITTSTLSGIDLPLEGIIEGGKGEVKYYSNTNHLINELERVVSKYMSQDISRNDIVILSCFKHKNSSLSAISKLAGHRVVDLTEDGEHLKGIECCTFQAFKGLERRIVLAIDLLDMKNDQSRLLHYCGLSRARSILTVFLNDNDKNTYEQLAYEFGQRMAKKEADN